MRVAITRPRERAKETIELVKAMGWTPLIVPAIEIVPIEIPSGIVLKDFDWLVVTSASAVPMLVDRFGDGLHNIKIAVVGPKTKTAFEMHGIEVSFVSSVYAGEALGAELSNVVSGQNILITRAKKGRREIVSILKEAGNVTELSIYDTIFPNDTKGLEEFKRQLLSEDVDAVILTSSEATRNLVKFLRDDALVLNDLIVCAIGHITAKTSEELGLRVTCVPDEFTVDAALQEISKQIV